MCDTIWQAHGPLIFVQHAFTLEQKNYTFYTGCLVNLRNTNASGTDPYDLYFGKSGNYQLTKNALNGGDLIVRIIIEEKHTTKTLADNTFQDYSFDSAIKQEDSDIVKIILVHKDSKE